MGSHSFCAGGDAAQSSFAVVLCFKLVVKWVMKYHSLGGKLLSMVCFSLFFPVSLQAVVLSLSKTCFNKAPTPLRKTAA